ncbi:MAG: AAA family ATPase [bacterium]|nr:AAA family ATPase [bacterium]
MKRFYITGVSGTGKSSVSLKLKEKGIPSIDIDKIKGLCHWENKKTKKITRWYPGIGSEFLSSHKYVCDVKKLLRLMKKFKKIIVVVGITDNQSEFFQLFDKILFFHCNKATFLKRIKKRTDNNFGKHKSEQKMLLEWYQEFKRKMTKRGAVPINTNESLNVVVKQVIKQIQI